MSSRKFFPGDLVTTLELTSMLMLHNDHVDSGKQFTWMDSAHFKGGDVGFVISVLPTFNKTLWDVLISCPAGIGWVFSDMVKKA